MFGLFGCHFADSTDPDFDDSLLEEESGVSDEVNDVLTNVMPWLVSLFIHVGVVVLAIFVVWSVQTVVEEEKIIIPEIRMGPTPGTPLSVTRPEKMEQAASSRRTTSRQITRTRATVTSKSTQKPQTMGVTSAMSASASPFGAGPNIGEGLSVGFFGNGGNAQTVAFVIDSSGSLFDTMPFVIDELKRAVGKLQPEQSFTVIFFEDGQVKECPVPRRGLRPATRENIQQVIKWIDLSSGNITPRGKTDPTEAIKMSLKYEPELMFILSDNIIGQDRFGLEPHVLVKLIDDHNTKPTAINTIQFIYPDPLVKLGLEPTLKQISEKTGGKYKFVSQEDLGTR